MSTSHLEIGKMESAVFGDMEKAVFGNLGSVVSNVSWRVQPCAAKCKKQIRDTNLNWRDGYTS